MIASFHPDIFSVANSVIISNPWSFEIHGIRFRVSNSAPHQNNNWTGNGHLAELSAELAANLYWLLYCKNHNLPNGSTTLGTNNESFLEELSNANSGTGHWESGWALDSRSDRAQIVVSKYGLRFLVGPSQVRVDDQVPRYCRIRVPKELRYLSPGYYLAIGNSEEDWVDPKDAVGDLRVYWHLQASVAAKFVHTATVALNDGGIPFRLKVLSDSRAYQRADAGVLYVSRRLEKRVQEVLAKIYGSVHYGLRDEIPLFTKQLAGGVAWADDPLNGQSFGQHISKLAAEGLVEAFIHGHAPRLNSEYIAASFARDGKSASEPYLSKPGETRARLEPLNKS
jgi:hypothetical protein